MPIPASLLRPRHASASARDRGLPYPECSDTPRGYPNKGVQRHFGCDICNTDAVTSTNHISISTVNLNGIRAAYKRGFTDWAAAAKPDVLLLQEVRADEDIARELLGDSWHTTVYPCLIKGRAGVAVAVRADSEAVVVSEDSEPRFGLGEPEDPPHSGRWLEVDLQTASGSPLKVVSAYFHSGEVGTPRQEYKYQHLNAITRRLEQLLVNAGVGVGETLVAGDFNVVRSESDIKNWKPNHNKRAGVLDDEIVFLNNWVENGWGDVVRNLAGECQGPYSWWSWRGKAYDNDAGWRIDYHYATPGLSAAARSYDIFRAPTWDSRFSDHAPVTVRYEV